MQQQQKLRKSQNSSIELLGLPCIGEIKKGKKVGRKRRSRCRDPPSPPSMEDKTDHRPFPGKKSGSEIKRRDFSRPPFWHNLTRERGKEFSSQIFTSRLVLFRRYRATFIASLSTLSLCQIDPTMNRERKKKRRGRKVMK